MWQRFDRMYSRRLICQRHEDRLSPDIPDVSCTRRSDGVNGWVELKTIEKWSGKTTKLRHLRPGQVNWLKTRGDVGAEVYLLLWVRESDEWLWIHGSKVVHEMWEAGFSKNEWVRLAGPHF